jgi:aspartate aminotransferase
MARSLSERSKLIKPSVTLAVTAQAQALRARGADLISFAAGEPDFDTPERIKQAAVRALARGMTKYTEVQGIEPLREAICAKYEREYGLKYTPAQVLVSCGGKHALYNLFQALLDEGDEVVIPSPYWVSYSDMAVLAGAVPKIVPTRAEDGFRLTPDALRSALTPRTALVILNSPSNPTGAAYDAGALAALGAVLETHDCWIVSDDIYEKIVYDGFEFRPLPALRPGLSERTIIVNGVSKTYAMTGWRIGYALGPAPVIAAAAKIQSQSTSNPTSIAQAAALEALAGPQTEVAEMVRAFQLRRDLVVARLNAIPGLECFKPQGAFYVFPSVRSYFGREAAGRRIDSACDLATYLLERAGVAVVPGEDFGSGEHIRLTYANSLEEIEKGCERIAQALRPLAG